MHDFLKDIMLLQVHLCCGNQSLGCATVPLSNLINKDSTEIYMKPVTEDASYPVSIFNGANSFVVL